MRGSKKALFDRFGANSAPKTPKSLRPSIGRIAKTPKKSLRTTPKFDPISPSQIPPVSPLRENSNHPSPTDPKPVRLHPGPQPAWLPLIPPTFWSSSLQDWIHRSGSPPIWFTADRLETGIRKVRRSRWPNLPQMRLCRRFGLFPDCP